MPALKHFRGGHHETLRHVRRKRLAVIVSGELMIGESSSGRLVDEVKRTTKEEAGRINADLIIIDGPPGTGCPVIAAMKGSDYVIAATEPTPAALSDLGRLFDVIRRFDQPFDSVINKAGLHPASEDSTRGFLQSKTVSRFSPRSHTT
jgi:MinD superfamily P-loop ATPase